MDDRSALRAHAASFDKAADVYEAARPEYPREAVDFMVAHAAQKVLDLGAGTGKLTRLLTREGRTVHAVDPSPEMLRVLRSKLPAVDAREGSAESIPLPDASLDAVTVGQAWHWIDPQLGGREVARVLRPGGTLGLIWNLRDERVDWVRELSFAMDNTQKAYEGSGGDPVVGPAFEAAESIVLRWTQPYTPQQLVELALSRSYVIVKDEAGKAEVVARVRELLATHPSLAGREVIELPYVTEAFRYRVR